MNDAVHDLKMPSFGADMAKGTLIEWHVKEGEQITRGSVIAVIETNKGAIDLDVFEDAVIEKLLLKEGEEVAVGTPIARLRSVDESAGKQPETTVTQKIPAQPAPDTHDKAETLQTSAKTEEQPGTKVTSSSRDFVYATPAARAFARRQGLSLQSIQAINPKKVITLAMLEKMQQDSDAASVQYKSVKTETKPSPKTSGGFDKDAMRQAISDTVTRSKQNIPHYYLSQRLDITVLEKYLHKFNENAPPESRILLAAPLLCAIARTLMQNKQLNGLYQNNNYSPSDTVNLANAINLRGGGLVMPVIRNAQLLTAVLMMEQLKEQVARARSASLRVSELSDASFTVTSIGERGAEQMFAVIYPPQVAIVALGTAHQEALVIDGEIKVRTIIEATLAADHRVSDGHIGARLLYQLNQKLQKPEDLWIVEN